MRSNLGLGISDIHLPTYRPTDLPIDLTEFSSLIVWTHDESMVLNWCSRLSRLLYTQKVASSILAFNISLFEGGTVCTGRWGDCWEGGGAGLLRGEVNIKLKRSKRSQPSVGIEPTTSRLLSECSTTKL